MCADEITSQKVRRARQHIVLASLLTSVSTLALAGPLVYEEKARIANPDSRYGFPRQVAIEGDWIIATGSRSFRHPEDVDRSFINQAAFLFQRESNGTWAYRGILAEDTHEEQADDPRPMTVSIRNGRAAVYAAEVRIFERTAAGWVRQPSDAFAHTGHVSVGGNSIVASLDTCTNDTYQFLRNSNGVWVRAGSTTGDYNGCDTEANLGTDVHASPSDHFIVAQTSHANVHDRTTSGWTLAATLRDPNPRNDRSFGDPVAMDDQRAFVSGMTPSFIHVFNRANGWAHSGVIAPSDAAFLIRPNSLKVRDIVAAGLFRDSARNGSVGLFRVNAAGGYDYVARLVPSDSQAGINWFPDQVDLSNQGGVVRVVATGGDNDGPNQLYVFEPAQLGVTAALRQDTFQSGNAAQWSTTAGSAFTVVASNGGNVYRQSYFGGDASAFFTSIDWRNQAIEADVKPTAFNGADRWAGLIVRRTDSSNYYYVTLRSSNSLQIRRMRNGSFVSLASAPVTVSLNRTYRVRLEAVGARLRAYVDGRLVTEVSDTTLARGHVGLMTSKARADFDNVVISQDPHVKLVRPEVAFLTDVSWALGPGTWTPVGEPLDPLAQTSTAGDARMVSLVNARDQSVSVNAQATSFASESGEKWFGLMARYRDASNYYYVTLRNSNTISLRKLVNGTIQVLDTAPLTVTPGVWYSVRLDAIGNQVRAYVNGTLLVEATDTSHPQGRYGIASYKAAGLYQEFVGYQP